MQGDKTMQKIWKTWGQHVFSEVRDYRQQPAVACQVPAVGVAFSQSASTALEQEQEED